MCEVPTTGSHPRRRSLTLLSSEATAARRSWQRLGDNKAKTTINFLSGALPKDSRLHTGTAHCFLRKILPSSKRESERERSL